MGSTGFSPANLRILVEDDDKVASKNLETILKKHKYKVKTCNLAMVARNMLEEKNEKYRFDLVMSDVNMRDMDGFEFLLHVTCMIDIPVIMMSEDGETSKVMEGIRCGACYYLHKPIQPKDIKFIWKHVYCKRMNQIIGGNEDSHTIAGNKRKKLVENGDSSSSVKKPRVRWTIELQEKFEKIVEQIERECGYNEVTPKKILELMRDPWLTRDNIASHLQKHRLKKAALEVSHTNIYPQQSVVMLSKKNHQNTMINENGGHNNIQVHNQLVANHINLDQGLDPSFQNLQLPPTTLPYATMILDSNVSAVVPPNSDPFDWRQFLNDDPNIFNP